MQQRLALAPVGALTLALASAAPAAGELCQTLSSPPATLVVDLGTGAATGSGTIVIGDKEKAADFEIFVLGVLETFEDGETPRRALLSHHWTLHSPRQEMEVFGEISLVPTETPGLFRFAEEGELAAATRAWDRGLFHIQGTVNLVTGETEASVLGRICRSGGGS